MLTEQDIFCRWFGEIREIVLGSGHKIDGGTACYREKGDRLECECTVKGKRVSASSHKLDVIECQPRESVHVAYELIAKIQTELDSEKRKSKTFLKSGTVIEINGRRATIRSEAEFVYLKEKVPEYLTKYPQLQHDPNGTLGKGRFSTFKTKF